VPRCIRCVGELEEPSHLTGMAAAAPDRPDGQTANPIIHLAAGCGIALQRQMSLPTRYLLLLVVAENAAGPTHLRIRWPDKSFQADGFAAAQFQRQASP